jgi:NADPH:quinone reductase-like Zn-dependent oxidoreductase
MTSRSATQATEPTADRPRMQAIVQDRYGSFDVLEARTIDRPRVADDGVLVRVHAASVHVGDWILMTGSPVVMRMATGLRRPRNPVPGTDVAGIVEAVGRNVKRLRPGDAVFGWCAGAFAEYAAGSEAQFLAKPANLGFEQAAAVGVSASTALQLLRDDGKLRPGQKVLVNGASGGVGSFAVQIAKAFGAEVTGVTSTRNVDLVRSIGADHVIDYTRDDFTRRPERYDLVLDNVGNHSMARTRSVLTPTGLLISNGGGHAGGKLARTLRTSLVAMFVRGQARPSVKRQNHDDLVALRQLVEAGKVTPVIDGTYPLRDTAKAIARITTGRARGTIVISVVGPQVAAGAQDAPPQRAAAEPGMRQPVPS